MNKNIREDKPKTGFGKTLLIGAGLATFGTFWLRANLRKMAINRLALFPRVVGSRTPQHLAMPYEEVWFAARDGLKLHGWYIPAQTANTITIIMGHGHTGNKEPDLEYAEFFNAAGYNVFMFDFRGHGQSEGVKGSSLGYWERLDVHGAVDWLLGRGQEQFAAFGISMGAAILIMAAAENPYIRAVIADSAYAHLYDSIAAELNNLYRLPMWLANPVGRYAWRVLAQHHRFPLAAASPADYVAQLAPRPLLLIHGAQDLTTRVEHAYELYSLAKEPKELWIEPDVAHAQCFISYTDTYKRRVLEFLARVDWQTPPTLQAASQTLEGLSVS